MNEYTEKYKTFDNGKLLSILEEAEKYRPEAIEAAKAEIANRNISPSETKLFQEALSAKQALAASRQKRITEAENKVKSAGSAFFKTISPIQEEPQTISQKINLLVFLFTAMSVYNIYEDFGFLLFMFKGSIAEWDLETLLYFLPLLLLLPATILFWMRKPAGWIIWCSYSTYVLINLTFSFYLDWVSSSNHLSYEQEGTLGGIQLDYVENPSIFSPTEPIVYITALAAFGAILWVLNQAGIRAAFQLKAHTAKKTLALTFAIIVFIFYFYSL